MKNNIWERLDRGVANLEWWSCFPCYFIRHIPHSFLDHCPLLMDTLGHKDGFVERRKFPFRFNSEWILEGTFEVQLKRIWGSSNDDILRKLARLGNGLIEWAKNNYEF